MRRTAGEKIISSLLETIDCDALRARAEFLRDGTKCKVNLPTAPESYFNFDIIGGRNYHGSILFEDGIIWLARFRLPNHNMPPIKEKNFDRRSEFATYKFLANTAIPVPQVYDVADDEDDLNSVGAGYILLEKLPGRSMVWDEASEEQKISFSRQLADFYIDLEQHPFSKLGRLELSPTGHVEVGPAFFDYDSNREPSPVGPFTCSNDYYTEVIRHQIRDLQTDEISAISLDDLCLMYTTLVENLPPNEIGPFFLRHVDTRDVNFLVNEDYKITGIIDWELAIVTFKGSAFQSPLLMYNLGQLYNEGLSTPCDDEKRLVNILQGEKGAVDLAKLAAKKLHFRVEQILEADSYDREGLVGRFTGWWKLISGVETFDWDTWCQQAQGMDIDAILARARNEA